jgi:DNA-binding transcriptional LysR family regulator
MTNYDLTDLRVFIAVADEGNLSRGAQRCHLAPSSVSLRLKGLEEVVGAALFTRDSRGVALTRAGRVMLEHAQRCMAQLEQMHADLLPFAQGLTGHLTFYANNNAISAHLPADLARFFTAYPSVRITLQERLSSDVVVAVASGRADIGVVALSTPHPALEYRPYRLDQLVVLAPLTSTLAAQRSVAFAACLREPFISLQQGAALHTFLMNQAAALGGRLDLRVQVSGYRSVARLVASGAGIGIVPRSAIEASDLEQVCCVELTDGWARRELSVCVRPGAVQESHFLHALVDQLCASAPVGAGVL